MAEYITEFFGSSSGGSYTERREEIVRCQDCRFFKPREGATLNCRFEHPTMPNTVQWKIAEPDGFCKWGEGKKDD